MRRLAVMAVIAVGASLFVAAMTLPAAASERAHAAAGPKKGGRYSGTTTQHLPIRLRVSRSGKTVTGSIAQRLPCQDGFTFSFGVSFAMAIRNHRTFGGSFPFNGDVPDNPSVGQGDLKGQFKSDVRGTFSRPDADDIYHRASGRWHTHVNILDGNGALATQCDATFRFGATLRR